MSSILGNILYIFSATVASRIFGVVRSFLLARTLDPADFGTWVFVSLIISYAPIVSLGMGEALLKKVPFFLGKKDMKSLKAVEGGVLSFSILLAIVFVPVILVIPRVLVTGDFSRFTLPVQIMLAAVCFSFFTGFFTLRLQAYQRFPFLSAVTTARALAFLVLQIGLSYLFGLIGAFIGFLACEIFICLYSGYLNTRLPNALSVRFSGTLYGNLIRTGLPITVIWWTYILQTSVDRVVSMAMLGDVQTGFYGIGMSIATTYLLIPDSINQVLYPSVNEKYGQTSNRSDLIPLVVQPARIMSLVLPFFAFISLLLLPLIFRYIVPKYVPGLQATQILILAALFNGMTRSGTNLLISIDRQGRVILYIVCTIVLNLAGNFILVKAGFGINGIATATAISAAFLAAAVWFSAFSALYFSVQKGAGMIARLFSPPLLFALLSLVDYFITNRTGTGTLVSSGVTVASFVFYLVLLSVFPSYRHLVKESVQAGIASMRSRRGQSQLSSPARGE